MSDKKGVIYILTNPSFPDYVKIGQKELINRNVNGSQAIMPDWRIDIVNIGLHFFLKNVRPYAASCSEAQYCCRLTIGGSPPLAEQILRLFQQLMKYLQMSVFNCSTVIAVGS